MTGTTTYPVTLEGLPTVDVRVTERGHGPAILLLHGGAGRQSVAAFADLLADARSVRVITPTHPGFDGTDRPDALAGIRPLAALYIGLLGAMDLRDVTVVGNSIGGWITAEMALLPTDRLRAAVLVDAVGIEVPGHPVVDFFSLTLDEVAQHSYYEPDKFRIDLSALPEGAAAVMAGNRRALTAYGGSTMTDPSLRARLHQVAVPTTVIWGEADRIADPDYGRAYAAAIPGASFVLLEHTGHVPQIETPDQLRDVIGGVLAAA